MADIILPQDVPVGTEITVVSTGYKLERTKGDRRRFERTAPPVVVPPPVEPPPPPVPPTAVLIHPGDDIKVWLASGARDFLLWEGTHKLSLGSSETQYAGVSIAAYGSHRPVIDGTGLDPHFVYLGPKSGTWKLTDIALRNFFPTGSGVIGIGDGCRLEMTRVSMVGKGGTASNQDHGVYFHGTGTGSIGDSSIRVFPGSALQTYRGSPKVDVVSTVLEGLYVGVFAYSGHINLTDSVIRSNGPNDIDVQRPADITLVGCTGGGAAGMVRVWHHS